jgi:hypothetical protein
MLILFHNRIKHPYVVLGGPCNGYHKLADISHNLPGHLYPHKHPANEYHPDLVGEINVGKPSVAHENSMRKVDALLPLAQKAFKSSRKLEVSIVFMTPRFLSSSPIIQAYYYTMNHPRMIWMPETLFIVGKKFIKTTVCQTKRTS